MAANSTRSFDKVLSDPRRWRTLTAAELGDLLKFGCVVYGTTADDTRAVQVSQLLAHVVETVPVESRRQVVVDLGAMLEDYGRAHGVVPVGALFPFVLDDPDFVVISTASLQVAQLMPLQDGDPLTGPRTVLELARAAREPRRQVAILSGLTALGDEDVFDLLEASWHRFDRDTQTHLVAYMGHQPATVAAVEFLVTRLERWIAEGHEGPIGHAAPTLIRLAQRAGCSPDRPRAGETGVFDLERAFPSWSLPPDVNAINIRRTYSVDEFGRRIARRLARLAALESYPRILPTALRAWGADDGPFIKTLRAAARKHFSGHTGARLLDLPVEIEPVPDWDRDDCLLEWGILNPFGPTKVQWCLVPLEGQRRALVYTLHNPFAPVCLLLGVVMQGDSGTPHRMLLDLADRFELGDHLLLKGLPHWVRTNPVGGVRINDNEGAVIFERLHKAALSRGVADDADLAGQIESLQRLRQDPQAEIRRQVARAMKRPGRPAPARGPVADDYLPWYRIVSSSEHVRALASQFMPCWNTAMRLQAP